MDYVALATAGALALCLAACALLPLSAATKEGMLRSMTAGTTAAVAVVSIAGIAMSVDLLPGPRSTLIAKGAGGAVLLAGGAVRRRRVRAALASVRNRSRPPGRLPISFRLDSRTVRRRPRHAGAAPIVGRVVAVEGVVLIASVVAAFVLMRR